MKTKALEIMENVNAVAAVMAEIPGLESRVLHKAIRHARLMQEREDKRGESFKTRCRDKLESAEEET